MGYIVIHKDKEKGLKLTVDTRCTHVSVLDYRRKEIYKLPVEKLYKIIVENKDKVIKMG